VLKVFFKLAGNNFLALKELKMCTRKLPMKVRCLVFYHTVVRQQLNRLQMFHNSCVRGLCRVTMWQVREHKITQVNLERWMQLEPFEYYLASWRLQWAGHVSRMPFSRLPHIFLSSWVDHKRKQQRPQSNYGHGLLRDIKNAEVHLKA
jgi:hypothetical protein